MQQMSTSDMLILCVGALLFGMLIGTTRKRPRATKYAEAGSLAGTDKPARRKILIGALIVMILLYIAAVVVMMFVNAA